MHLDPDPRAPENGDIEDALWREVLGEAAAPIQALCEASSHHTLDLTPACTFASGLSTMGGVGFETMGFSFSKSSRNARRRASGSASSVEAAAPTIFAQCSARFFRSSAAVFLLELLPSRARLPHLETS